MLFDFVEFEKGNYEYDVLIRSDVNYMIRRIKEYINLSDIKIFYPKYLFVKDKKIELFSFTEDIILYATTENEGIELERVFKINVLKIKDIKSINIRDYEKYDSPVVLDVYFKNSDEVLKFNSMEDTNDGFAQDFKKYVHEIAKFLIEKIG